MLSLALALGINTYYLRFFLLGGETIQTIVYPNEAGLVVNSASLFVAEISLILFFFACIYSVGYMKKEIVEDNAYFTILLLFATANLVMAMTYNVMLIYATLEAGTITGGVLIIFSRRRSSVLAAFRFFWVSLVGTIVVLIGILFQHYLVGSFMITELADLSTVGRILLAVIFTVGFGIKAGIAPFGLLWLPPAHSEAPVPIHATLSGVLVQIAAFAAVRVVGAIAIGDVNSAMAVGQLLAVLGIASMIVGALFALIESMVGSKYSRFHVGSIHVRGIKRVWAFSTVSEVGYIYLFSGLALIMPKLFFVFLGGMLIHLLNHGLSKVMLLFNCGVMIKKAHAENLLVMGDLSGKLGTSVSISYALGFLSLSLIPGTLGYSTFRELILVEMPLWSQSVAVATIATLIITFITGFWTWYTVLFRKPKVKIIVKVKQMAHVPLTMVAPNVILAIAILVIGLFYTLGTFGVFLGGFEAFHHLTSRLARSVISLG